MKVILKSLVLSLLVILPAVLAQSDAVTKGLLRSVIGPLPEACISSLNSADCIACLGTVKVLPFAFFFGLAYFAMAFIVLRIFGGLPTVGGQPQALDVKKLTPSFYYAAILISLTLALLTLHFRETSMLFVNIGQFYRILILAFSIVVVVTFLWSIQGLHPMLNLAVIVFSISIVWTLYNVLTRPGELSLFEPIVPLTDSMCFLVG